MRVPTTSLKSLNVFSYTERDLTENKKGSQFL